MPWKECHVDGRAAPVCRPPARGREDGAAVRGVRDLAQDRLQDLRALQGLRRRTASPIAAAGPYRHANQLPLQSKTLIVRLKREYPGWGAPKIREKLRRRCDRRRSCPAISTVHAVLDRHGLVQRRRRRRLPRRPGTALSRPDRAQRAVVRRLQGRVHARQSALLLSADDHRLRQPLPADAARRCRPPRSSYAFTVFERTFKEFGLPHAIRTDNGVPFASAHALYGLSKLSVWWLRLGIAIERIKPGHPEQNGRHERMHLTLKKEATKPAAAERPAAAGALRCLRRALQPRAAASGARHEGAGRRLRARHRAPIAASRSSTIRSTTATITVTHCGRICFKGRKVNLSQVFAGQNVGVTQVGERIWLVTFMHYDLGYFDDETCRLEPIENPFGAESVTHVSGMNCYPCVRNGPMTCGAPCRTRTCDLLVRSQTLYPTELRAREGRTKT